MVAYLIFLALVLWGSSAARHRVRERVPVHGLGASACFPPASILTPASGPYREALYSRDYFFLYNWTWYHWVGMLAPLAILALFWRRRFARNQAGLRSAELRHAAVRTAIHRALAIFLASSPSLDMFARLQPLRTFHLITLVLVLLLSGVVGEYLAKDRPWVTGCPCPAARHRHVLRGARNLSQQPADRAAFPDQFQCLGEHAALGAESYAPGRRLCRRFALLHGS